MKNNLCFVQFIHPGGEHCPTHDKVCEWNTGDHKRKFLVQEGSYLNGNEVKTDNLMFWGEWEPQSDTEQILSSEQYGPKYFHKPYYTISDTKEENKSGICGDNEGCQNTDPFIFGEPFLYSNCKQLNKKSLKHLDRGSVILFGSKIHGSFVLDTVFVVDHWEILDKNFKEILKDKVSETFMDVTASRLSYSSSISYRLYFGATYKKPIFGMYSFFPCLPYKQESKGFTRPRIVLDGFLTQSLMQGLRLNVDEVHNDIEIVRSLWEEVIEQVKEQGLMLGIETMIPPKIEQKNNSNNLKCRTFSQRLEFLSSLFSYVFYRIFKL